MGSYRTQAQLIHDVAETIVKIKPQGNSKKVFDAEVAALEKNLTGAMSSNNVRFTESLGKR